MRIIITCLIALLVYSQGCTFDKPFTKSDITSITSLKIVRYETPKIKRINPVTPLDLILLSTIVIDGGITVAALQDAANTVKGSIPDFGKLVIKKFVERTNKEIPDWPTTMVIEKPLTEDDYDDYFMQDTILEFEFSNLVIHYKSGFTSTSKVTMGNFYGKKIWKKKFTYQSDRNISVDKYEADNHKLLIEEMNFAVEKTVSNFIEHLKRSMGI